MADIVAFSRNIRKRSSQIENGASRLLKQVSKRCLKNLIFFSPIVKGDMRSNYRVSVGGRATARIAAYSPQSRKNRGKDGGNGAAAYQAGASKIDAISGPIRSSITISNNVPYLDKVNYETAKQVPTGFVERAVSASMVDVPQFRFFDNSGDDE